MAKSLKYWASCGVVRAVSKVYLGENEPYMTEREDGFKIDREERRMTQMFWAKPSYRLLVIWKLINEAFQTINYFSDSDLVDRYRRRNLYFLKELYHNFAKLDEVVSDDEMKFLERKVARARDNVTKNGCNRLRQYVPRLRQIISEKEWKSDFLQRVEARELVTRSNDVFQGPAAGLCGRRHWEIDDGPVI